MAADAVNLCTRTGENRMKKQMTLIKNTEVKYSFNELHNFTHRQHILKKE